MTYDVVIEGKKISVELEQSEGQWTCRLNGKALKVDAILTRPDVLSILVEGKAFEVRRERSAVDMHLWVGSSRYAAELRDPRSLRSRKGGAGESNGPKKLMAPMPGKIVRVLVSEGDQVEAKQGILVIEAMKMQNEVKSPKKGRVQKLSASIGSAVNPGDVLAIIE